LLNDIGINEKNPDRPSVLMDLGLSRHYAQVLTIPIKNSSNMINRNKRNLF